MHGVRESCWHQQHRKVDHGKETIPTVVMDYFYLGEEEGAKPNFVAKDRKTGMMFATSMEKKGLVDPTTQKLLTRFLEVLGYKEVILKSDGERSIVRMKMEAAKQARGLVKAVAEESPKGDAQSNVQAEATVKEVKWKVRAVQLMLEKKLEGGIPDQHPLLYWLPRYVAEQTNRYKIGEDGRTAEERRTGKKWSKPMPLFGERILAKPCGKGKRGDVAKMIPGRYVGTHNRFGSILAMTEQGVIVGTGYHTVAEEEKWKKLEEGFLIAEASPRTEWHRSGLSTLRYARRITIDLKLLACPSSSVGDLSSSITSFSCSLSSGTSLPFVFSSKLKPLIKISACLASASISNLLSVPSGLYLINLFKKNI